MIPPDKIVLKCKTCGYEMRKEKVDSHSLIMCPQCKTVGYVEEKFESFTPII